ncbi:hypothetical protein GOB83_03250 [Acetobacter fabarum]|uniref:hypothetical protein n=1 Tax=Acetobacter fabarum TaxID=483199 RepID=UPI0014047746|nr:hypothetical protein [Acetobacter fabarum]NHO41222.1 hypothetical protein [Acetobacter fabarum]
MRVFPPSFFVTILRRRQRRNVQKTKHLLKTVMAYFLGAVRISLVFRQVGCARATESLHCPGMVAFYFQITRKQADRFEASPTI